LRDIYVFIFDNIRQIRKFVRCFCHNIKFCLTTTNIHMIVFIYRDGYIVGWEFTYNFKKYLSSNCNRSFLLNLTINQSFNSQLKIISNQFDLIIFYFYNYTFQNHHCSFTGNCFHNNIHSLNEFGFVTYDMHVYNSFQKSEKNK